MSRVNPFMAVVTAAAEAAKSHQIADDIMQRDLARVVSTEAANSEAPTLTKSHTMRRMHSVAAMKLERQATGLQPAKPSGSGNLDGRHIMLYSTRHVLLPHHLQKQAWNAFALVFGIFEFVSLPYAVAFKSGQPVAALLVVDAVFLCDMVLTFFTAYRERATSRLVLDRRAIVHHYLRTTFALDLLALLPLWLIGPFAPFMQLLKLLRLRCLSNLNRETRITSSFSHIYEVFTQILVFVLLLHLCCCTLQLIGRATAESPELHYAMGSAEYVRRVYITFALVLGDGGIWMRE